MIYVLKFFKINIYIDLIQRIEREEVDMFQDVDPDLDLMIEIKEEDIIVDLGIYIFFLNIKLIEYNFNAHLIKIIINKSSLKY